LELSDVLEVIKGRKIFCHKPAASGVYTDRAGKQKVFLSPAGTESRRFWGLGAVLEVKVPATRRIQKSRIRAARERQVNRDEKQAS
jgi:hypothetical protein